MNSRKTKILEICLLQVSRIFPATWLRMILFSNLFLFHTKFTHKCTPEFQQKCFPTETEPILSRLLAHRLGQHTSVEDVESQRKGIFVHSLLVIVSILLAIAFFFSFSIFRSVWGGFVKMKTGRNLGNLNKSHMLQMTKSWQLSKRKFCYCFWKHKTKHTQSI